MNNVKISSKVKSSVFKILGKKVKLFVGETNENKKIPVDLVYKEKWVATLDVYYHPTAWMFYHGGLPSEIRPFEELVLKEIYDNSDDLRSRIEEIDKVLVEEFQREKRRGRPR
jgi:hypothetical protein